MKTKTTEIIDQLEQLNSILENSRLEEGPATKVTDNFEMAKPMLTPKALEAMERTAKTLIHKDSTGVYQCIFLGVTVKTKNIKDAVTLITSELNALAEKDLIHSTLAKPSSIDLVRLFGEEQTSAVFSYVLVPYNRVEEATAIAKTAMKEGEVGKPMEDISIELKDGEFLAYVSFSHFSALQSSKGIEQRLHETINQYLAVLPEGTELVNVTRLAIVSLSLGFEVRFKNPLMNAYKQVELEYTREFERVDGVIKQFDLFHGVKYTKRNA